MGNRAHRPGIGGLMASLLLATVMSFGCLPRNEATPGTHDASGSGDAGGDVAEGTSDGGGEVEADLSADHPLRQLRSYCTPSDREISGDPATVLTQGIWECQWQFDEPDYRLCRFDEDGSYVMAFAEQCQGNVDNTDAGPWSYVDQVLTLRGQQWRLDRQGDGELIFTIYDGGSMRFAPVDCFRECAVLGASD